MKQLLSALLALTLLVPATVNAVEKADAQEAAFRLMDAMGMETALAQSIDASLDTQLKNNPELGPYRSVFRSFLAKYMSYEALKPQLASLYASEFSASELDAAAAFYRTAAGRKFMEKMPALMSKSMELGQQAVQDHLPELQDAIKAEATRLQQISGAPSAGEH
jgi:hypothetical protein